LRLYDDTPGPEKLACTSRDWVIIALQVLVVPIHAPLHPVKVLPGSAVAVSRTDDFQPYAFVQ
jgi:hypothetical protein